MAEYPQAYIHTAFYFEFDGERCESTFPAVATCARGTSTPSQSTHPGEPRRSLTYCWLLPRDSLGIHRLNDMIEVGAIEGLVTGSKIYMRYDTYTDRGVRVHVRRLQDMMQPSSSSAKLVSDGNGQSVLTQMITGESMQNAPRPAAATTCTSKELTICVRFLSPFGKRSTDRRDAVCNRRRARGDARRYSAAGDLRSPANVQAGAKPPTDQPYLQRLERAARQQDAQGRHPLLAGSRHDRRRRTHCGFQEGLLRLQVNRRCFQTDGKQQ